MAKKSPSVDDFVIPEQNLNNSEISLIEMIKQAIDAFKMKYHGAVFHYVDMILDLLRNLISVHSISSGNSRVSLPVVNFLISTIYYICPSKILYSHDTFILSMIAVTTQSTKYDFYGDLFKHSNVAIRVACALNPNAVLFEEYKRLIQDKEELVRRAVARNQNAQTLKEFKTLFYDNSPQVRLSIALNYNNACFEEFVSLLNDKYQDVKDAASKSIKRYLDQKNMLEFEMIMFNQPEHHFS
jgi:hypothetical protein